jgi:hypothetical protein
MGDSIGHMSQNEAQKKNRMTFASGDRIFAHSPLSHTPSISVSRQSSVVIIFIHFLRLNAHIRAAINVPSNCVVQNLNAKTTTEKLNTISSLCYIPRQRHFILVANRVSLGVPEIVWENQKLTLHISTNFVLMNPFLTQILSHEQQI